MEKKKKKKKKKDRWREMAINWRVCLENHAIVNKQL